MASKKKSQDEVISKKSSKTSVKKVTTTTPSSELPKRRGRKPNKIVEETNLDAAKKKTSKSKKNSEVNDIDLRIDEVKEVEETIKQPKTNIAVTLKLPSKTLSMMREHEEKNKFPKLNLKSDDLDTECSDIDSEMESDGESSSKSFEIHEVQNDNCKGCIKREAEIKKLQNKIDKHSTIASTNVNRAYYHDLKLANQDGQIIDLVKTNICCFWDTEPINDIPFYMPDGYEKGVFNVRQVLCCSESCLLAYNSNRLKDDAVDERKVLIFNMASKIRKIPLNKLSIVEAGPFELLTKFGGNKTIAQFREDSRKMKNIKMYQPPLKPLIPLVIEEIENADSIKNQSPIIKNSLVGKNKSDLISLGVVFGAEISN